MALRGELGSVFAKVFLEIVVAIIQRVYEMRSGPRGHAAPNQTIIQNNYLIAPARQGVGNGQPGNPGADDTNVGARVLPQRIECLRRRSSFPERDVAARPLCLILN